jgi:hypothetical protein
MPKSLLELFMVSNQLCITCLFISARFIVPQSSGFIQGRKFLDLQSDSWFLKQTLRYGVRQSAGSEKTYKLFKLLIIIVPVPVS